ncbi:MAG: hypothetical protein Q4C63_08880 [Eubacteriales bacterium]|nr:hypothetical protein [Eubacteriales bacterium]
MKKKWIRIATIGVFVLMITALPLSWYLKPEEERTDNSENRVLAELPQVTEAEDILNVPQAFDAYYSDHLPYKEKMVSIKSDVEMSLFQQLDSDQVILGTEAPWLFYKAADGQPLENYKHTNPFSEESMAKIAEVLYSLQTKLYEEGTDFVLIIAPDKETIYGPDYMPSDIKVMEENPQRTEQLLAYLEEHAPDIKIIYPKDVMMAEKKGLETAAEEATAAAKESDGTGAVYAGWPLYYESDTHWNKIGAKVCADELFDLLAETDRNYLTEYIDVTITDLGDGSDEAYPAGEKMYKKGDMQTLAQLPDSFNSQEFRAEGTLPADETYLVKAPGGEEVYQRYRSADSRCAKKSLYFVGDSFRWNIADFLKGRTEDCTIASRYYLDLADVAEQQPDVFVYMLAERYLHELEVLPGVAAPALAYTDEFQKADIY